MSVTLPIPTIAQAQARLVALGFSVGPRGVDGLGGPATRAAILAFQTSRKLPQTGQFDAATVNALFAGTVHTPTISLGSPVVRAAIELLLPSLLEGLPMGNLINFAAGAKSFILGGLMIAYGAAELIGWSIPAFGSPPPGATIAAGLALIFLRLGINNAVASAIESIVSGLGPKSGS